ncbi:spore germination protein KB [Evansella caseinilytica]|uniref:Spore germination protein KB n=1 Tax=Evansella caseinilytica TaxID=1503961 RepID=A0A1H3U6D1_9BACI|nr:endospore germination permease [Evansella caseinilytica]SDZ58043.1 spore germination protein KB [Evansella caseinilytica]
MIEKGRISSLQLAIIMYPTIIATAILIVPAVTATSAGRDMWLSPLWGTVTGFLSIFLAIKLNQYYPDKSIVEYSSDIIGKFFGKLVGLGYLFFLFHISGVIIREYADFVVGLFIAQTPMPVVIAGMIAVAAFAVRAGVEVIARSSELFIPIVIFIIFFILVLLIPEMDFLKIQPLFDGGIWPSIKGSATIQAWYSEFFLITFFLPFLSDKKRAVKWNVICLILIAVSLSFTNLATYLLFGALTEELSYPLISATRYISVADFFENIESVVMALWVAGAYVKITAFYYTFVIGTAQWLKLPNYRPLVFPIGIILVISGLWAAQSFTEVKDSIGKVLPFYLPLFGTAIPFALLIIAALKKKIIAAHQSSEQA